MAFVVGSGSRDAGLLMIPVVWVCGAAYCAARLDRSNKIGSAKIILGFIAFAMLFLSLFILCPRGGAPPLLEDLFRYGWNGKYVSHNDRTLVIIDLALSAAYFLIDLADALVRRYVGGDPAPAEIAGQFLANDRLSGN